MQANKTSAINKTPDYTEHLVQPIHENIKSLTRHKGHGSFFGRYKDVYYIKYKPEQLFIFKTLNNLKEARYCIL